MNRAELKQEIQADYQAYPLKKSRWFAYMFNPGLKLTTALRRCQYYKQYRWTKPLYMFFRLRYHCLCMRYGFEVPSSVIIGSGARIHHPNGILINSRVRIGTGIIIHGGVKIGQNRPYETPTIGDNVNIGVNACIIGNVHVGDGAVIGAGAVVVKDVPPYTVVAGNPARVIKKADEFI